MRHRTAPRKLVTSASAWIGQGEAYVDRQAAGLRRSSDRRGPTGGEVRGTALHFLTRVLVEICYSVFHYKKNASLAFYRQKS